MPQPSGGRTHRLGVTQGEQGFVHGVFGSELLVATPQNHASLHVPQHKGDSLWLSPKFASSSWKTTTNASRPFARSRSTTPLLSAISKLSRGPRVPSWPCPAAS